MNFRSHLYAVVVLSLVNICLLLVAAFAPRQELAESKGSPLGVRIAYLAVSLGLCSQILCCLMLAIWRFSWVPFEPGVNSLLRLEGRFANVGGLLSISACLMAAFGKGLRRYATVWVGATTLYFWSMVGLGVSLSVLFR